MSTRHLLEALENIAATCGPKERALSKVTPRKFGREVVSRRAPSSCNEGKNGVILTSSVVFVSHTEQASPEASIGSS